MKLKVALTAAGAAVALLWPVLVYTGISLGYLRLLPALLLALCLLRLWLWRSTEAKGGQSAAPQALRRTGLYVLWLAALLCLASLILEQSSLLLYYPLAVSALFFMVFAWSLKGGRSVITELAALRESLDARAIAYTRAVTVVWCGFFLLNGTIAALTIYAGSLELWTLWNGALSYVAMGVLFALEYLVRCHLKRLWQGKAQSAAPKLGVTA